MERLELHLFPDRPSTRQIREREKKTRGILSRQILQRDNRRFAGTRGISENNHGLGFVPAYLDTQSGDAIVSRFADGRPAPVHILDGLPDSWVAARDVHGRVLKTRPGIIAGFIFDGRFYTRQQAAWMQRH